MTFILSLGVDLSSPNIAKTTVWWHTLQRTQTTPLKNCLHVCLPHCTNSWQCLVPILGRAQHYTVIPLSLVAYCWCFLRAYLANHPPPHTAQQHLASYRFFHFLLHFVLNKGPHSILIVTFLFICTRLACIHTSIAKTPPYYMHWSVLLVMLRNLDCF